MNVFNLTYCLQAIHNRHTIPIVCGVWISRLCFAFQRLFSIGALLLMVVFLNGESLLWCVYQFEYEDLAINYCQTDTSLGAIDEAGAFRYVCAVIDGHTENPTNTKHIPSLNLHDTRTLPPAISSVFTMMTTIELVCNISIVPLAEGYLPLLLRPPRTL
jgi:hypothetical protein